MLKLMIQLLLWLELAADVLLAHAQQSILASWHKPVLVEQCRSNLHLASMLKHTRAQHVTTCSVLAKCCACLSTCMMCLLFHRGSCKQHRHGSAAAAVVGLTGDQQLCYKQSSCQLS
jgi:hypothetical protein